MKLFLVSQNQNQGYDTYDSFVVICNSEDEAKNTHPSNQPMTDEKWKNKYGVWCEHINYVKVQYLGEADSSLQKGVVCSSFNAG